MKWRTAAPCWPNWLETQGSRVGWVMRGNRWWSRLLLWYNPVPLQNLHAALFPRGSKNQQQEAVSLLLALSALPAYTHLKSPFLAILQDLFTAVLCPSCLVVLVSLLDFPILLRIWGRHNLLHSNFQWSLSTNTDFAFQLVRLSLVWAEASAKVLTGFSQLSQIKRGCYPLCNMITQSLKGLTEAYRSLCLSNS